MVNTVVTGVDGSATATKAAEKAATLASAFSADLHIVSAFNVGMRDRVRSVRQTPQGAEGADAYEHLFDTQSQVAFQTASDVADQIRLKFPDITIKVASVEGTPGSAITEYAHQQNADVIVVGNRRVQGTSRVLGSVARAIAVETHCDLLIANTNPHN